MPKERTVTGKNENGSKRIIKNKQSSTIENKRVAVRDKAPRKKVARSEQRIHERTVEKKEITSVKRRVAASNVSRKSITNGDKSLKKEKKTRQAQTETGKKQFRGNTQQAELVAGCYPTVPQGPVPYHSRPTGLIYPGKSYRCQC